MKKSLRYLFCGLFLICGVNRSIAQWVQTNGPYGGQITSFATIGTNLFAGTDRGVFLSTNNGANWNAVSTGLGDRVVTSLAVIGTSIFAGCNGGGVFASSNNGTNWYSTGGPASIVNSLAVIGTSLFATSTQGIYRSTNSGGWINILAPKAIFNSIIAYPNGTGGMNLLVGGPTGVLQSTDEGASWTSFKLNLSEDEVGPVLVNDTNLFAGTYYKGVFLSTNNGTSWTTVNTGLTNLCILFLGVIHDASGVANLFAGTKGGIFRSTNNGTNWTAVNTGLTNTTVKSIFTHDSTLFAGTASGIFRSTDYGASWINIGVTSSTVNCLLICPDSTYGARLLTGSNSRGVSYSTDYGTSWINTDLSSTSVLSLANSSTTLFAGTYNRGVSFSTNNGTKWFKKGLGNYGVYSLAVSSDSTGGTKIFAGTFGGGVFRSFNNDTTWTAIDSGLTFTSGSWVYSLAMSPNRTKLFAAIWGGGVFLSTDYGTSWVRTGLTNYSLSSLAICTNAKSDTNIFAGTYGGVYLSSDNGATWVNKGLTDYWVLSLYVKGTSLFAGTRGGDVFSATVNATTWTRVSAGLPNTAITSLFAGSIGGIDTCLFAGTDGSGVWKRPLSEVLSSVDFPQKELPAQFTLEQNYPNPFNPSTTIRFSLPKAEYTTLQIFNTLGQEVAFLISEKLQAGTHSVQWRPSSISSGIYFCRLQAAELMQSKKLILLK